MTQSSGSLHEAEDRLSAKTKDMHRALVSLQEELEAIDWYQQRAEATIDGELRRILEHNRDEEKEHALMILEWLRRNDPKIDELLHTYLFTRGPLTEVEERRERAEALEGEDVEGSEARHGEPDRKPQAGTATAAAPTRLTVGSLID